MAEKLKVLIDNIPPMVMRTPIGYTGFEIELWEEIAKHSGLEFDYQPCEFHEMVTGLAEKKAEIGFGGLTINAKREELIDFSHPILDTGLSILINKDSQRLGFVNSVRSLLEGGRSILSRAFLLVFGFAFIMGNLMWFAE